MHVLRLGELAGMLVALDRLAVGAARPMPARTTAQFGGGQTRKRPGIVKGHRFVRDEGGVFTTLEARAATVDPLVSDLNDQDLLAGASL
jgi:hypothetical protein